jgi:twinkle protein
MTVIKFPSPAGLVSLRDLPEPPPLIPWYSGYPEFRDKMQLAPGMLSVVTGHPGHGKTSLMAQLWFNTAQINDLRIVVATFETHPVPNYRRMLRQFWVGIPQSAMTDEQLRLADDWIDSHYRFLIHPDDVPTLDWVMEWAQKDGNEFDALIIDPWNRLDSQRKKDETEHEYIQSSLISLRVFAARNRKHVQIIAHPAKRDIQYRKHFPVLEDISGSKSWDNIPDQGFCVHREHFYEEKTKSRRYDVRVHHLKSRFEELGYPCHFDMKLNPRTWCFEMAGADNGR